MIPSLLALLFSASTALAANDNHWRMDLWADYDGKGAHSIVVLGAYANQCVKVTHDIGSFQRGDDIRYGLNQRLSLWEGGKCDGYTHPPTPYAASVPVDSVINVPFHATSMLVEYLPPFRKRGTDNGDSVDGEAQNITDSVAPSSLEKRYLTIDTNKYQYLGAWWGVANIALNYSGPKLGLPSVTATANEAFKALAAGKLSTTVTIGGQAVADFGVLLRAGFHLEDLNLWVVQEMVKDAGARMVADGLGQIHWTITNWQGTEIARLLLIAQ